MTIISAKFIDNRPTLGGFSGSGISNESGEVVALIPAFSADEKLRKLLHMIISAHVIVKIKVFYFLIHGVVESCV